MADCPRLGKLNGGCKFRPRYDIGAPDVSAFQEVDALLLEALKPKTYVRDVCETCGKTVERLADAVVVRGGGI